jgi:NH3-dependent NAD+ synthetase
MQRLGRPASDVLAVTMPCFGTTKRTRSNAEILTIELGAELRCIDIAAVVNQHFSDIGHDPDNHNVVFENAQARARTYILMDLANQTNGMVIGTGDLSELALGWATYNGDHMSMYGVNASIPKTLIRCIVRHCAEHAASDTLRRVLIDIVDTPVSPELLPVDEGKMTQITEDIVGPHHIELGKARRHRLLGRDNRLGRPHEQELMDATVTKGARKVTRLTALRLDEILFAHYARIAAVIDDPVMEAIRCRKDVRQLFLEVTLDLKCLGGGYHAAVELVALMVEHVRS